MRARPWLYSTIVLASAPLVVWASAVIATQRLSGYEPGASLFAFLGVPVLYGLAVGLLTRQTALRITGTAVAGAFVGGGCLLLALWMLATSGAFE